jgi:hypothetical protein
VQTLTKSGSAESLPSVVRKGVFGGFILCGFSSPVSPQMVAGAGVYLLRLNRKILRYWAKSPIIFLYGKKPSDSA